MKRSSGYTIVEMIVTIAVFAIVAVSITSLVLSLLRHSATSTIRANAYALAIEKMEFLKSIPYDELAVQGGGIATSGTPLPAAQEISRSGRTYIVRANVQYADDAFDGCLDYPSNASRLCRNGPADASKPVDSNPRDYKIGEIRVVDKLSGEQYAKLSSVFTARVAETGGNTSAVMVQVIDSSGNPVNDADVAIKNTTLSPPVSQAISTDNNGIALFLDVPPDTNHNYVIKASKLGYSTLETMPIAGTLMPTYPNLSAFVQQVSSATLKIDKVSSKSLKITTVTPDGSVLPNASVTIRGGNKVYTDPEDDTYTFSQTVTTDSAGNAELGMMVPGDYTACHGANNSCGGTMFLAASRAAFGHQSFQPISIPAGNSVAANGYMQTVELVVTSDSSYPMISKISPSTASATSPDIGSTRLIISGRNLDGANVSLRQGAVNVSGSLVDSDTGDSISREFNLGGKPSGAYDLVIEKDGKQIVQRGLSPGSLGGLNVTP